MKVLVTTPCLEMPGGVANYYSTLRAYLPEGVEYLTIGSRGHNETTWEVAKRALGDYLELAKLLRQRKYELVHINPSLGSKSVVRDGLFLLIAKFLKRKVVVFVRGWDTQYERQLRKYYIGLFRYVYLKADAYIVLGSEFREKVEQLGYVGKIYQETTVVDDGVFEHFGKNLNINHHGQRQEKINLLVLTRIEKNKGVYESLDAYRILKEKYPEASLTIAGTGSEQDEIERYVDAKDITDVKFTGYVSGEEKQAVYLGADIYLFPTSYGEGMPNSCLRLWRMGCRLSPGQLGV